MRQAAKHRDPSTYRGGCTDSALLSEIRRREWARRSPEEKQRHLTAFIEAGQKNNKKNQKTRIESIVRDLLRGLGLAFEQNQQLGRYNVDFLVGETIIECFGDFWHCNPALYAPTYFNRSLHLTAQQKWEKDADRRANLASRGYRFFYFWESDIHYHTDEVRKRLAEIFGVKHEAD